MLTVFTGGARSGKSTAAVAAAASSGREVAFIATAEPGDAEMSARIDLHRAARPDGWVTLEAPLDIARCVDGIDGNTTIVIDCLSMWVANRMLAAQGGRAETDLRDPVGQTLNVASVLAAEARRLGIDLRARSGLSIVVTNEVGSGVVPTTPLGRAYRDVLGAVNQAITASADRACLVVAGRLLELREPAAVAGVPPPEANGV